MNQMKAVCTATIAAMALWAGQVHTQEVADPARNPLPNPNPVVVKDWGKLQGRVWGSTAGVDVGPDGHVWADDDER